MGESLLQVVHGRRYGRRLGRSRTRTPETCPAPGDVRSQELPVPRGRSGRLPGVTHIGRPRTELHQRPRPGAPSRLLHRHPTSERPRVRWLRDPASRPERRSLLAHRPHATGRKAMRTVERGRRQAIDSMLGGWQSEEVHDLARMISQAQPRAFRQRDRVVGRTPKLWRRPDPLTIGRLVGLREPYIDSSRVERAGLCRQRARGVPAAPSKKIPFRPPGFGHRLHMGQIQTKALEREVKFGAPLGVGLPDLRDLVSRTERLPRQQLQTAYFDTPDGRLWDQGITLRHRTTRGDGAGTWTLKLPAAAEGSTLNRTEAVLGRTAR